jgi:hypothetical protein
MLEYVLAVDGVLEMKKISGNLEAKPASKEALEYTLDVLVLGAAKVVVSET